MSEITIYEIGTKAKLPCGLDCEVQRANISRNGVSYEVGYWNGNSYVELWLPESQLTEKECSKRLTIGFKMRGSV